MIKRQKVMKDGISSMEYKCDWCDNEFTLRVGKHGDGKKNTVSTQVKCKKCGNYISTWDD